MIMEGVVCGRRGVGRCFLCAERFEGGRGTVSLPAHATTTTRAKSVVAGWSGRGQARLIQPLNHDLEAKPGHALSHANGRHDLAHASPCRPTSSWAPASTPLSTPCRSVYRRVGDGGREVVPRRTRAVLVCLPRDAIGLGRRLRSATTPPLAVVGIER